MPETSLPNSTLTSVVIRGILLVLAIAATYYFVLHILPPHTIQFTQWKYEFLLALLSVVLLFGFSNATFIVLVASITFAILLFFGMLLSGIADNSIKDPSSFVLILFPLIAMAIAGAASLVLFVVSMILRGITRSFPSLRIYAALRKREFLILGVLAAAAYAAFPFLLS